jgi:hypothetical protein
MIDDKWTKTYPKKKKNWTFSGPEKMRRRESTRTKLDITAVVLVCKNNK